jgi:hypothetical protein
MTKYWKLIKDNRKVAVILVIAIIVIVTLIK